MTFDEMCEFDVLYEAYKAARRGKRSKYSEAQYEANVLQLTERLSYILRSGKYHPSKFEVFYVREPKLRLVQAPAFVDKVVQHALVDNILYEAITRSFIQDNYASQLGKGTHYGLSRLKEAMLSYFRHRKGMDEEARRQEGLPMKPKDEWDYANGWVLKCDVRKFFASIDHDLVKVKLRERVPDDRIYDLMCAYIDSTNGLRSVIRHLSSSRFSFWTSSTTSSKSVCASNTTGGIWMTSSLFTRIRSICGTA